MSEPCQVGTVIEVRVPATAANLGPGFDSLALALGLYNTLELTVLTEDAETSIEIAGEGAQALVHDGENLVIGAMWKLEGLSGRSLPPFHLRMHNDIPLGRGLGSSAAAIAGGLMLAATTLGLDDRPMSLLKVALAIEAHPDNIVAALWGGFTIGVQHDSNVLVHRIQPPPDLRAVVLIPDQFSSTNESRATLPSSVTRADAVFNSGRTALLAAAFAEGKLELLRIAMEDRLHQSYRASVFCYLKPAIDSAIAAGAYGAALSGAGSSVIALASSDCADVATALERVATRFGLPARVVTLSPDIAGATVRVRTLGAPMSLS